jgi:hypothetical protein
MDKLLVTAIPCGLVVLSLFRMLQLMKSSRPAGEFFTLSLSAGVAALSLMWASVAIGHGFSPEPLSPAFWKASWTLGPVLGGLFIAALFSGSVAESVATTLGKLRRKPAKDKR